MAWFLHLVLELVIAAAEEWAPGWPQVHLCVCLQYCQLLRALLHLLLSRLKRVLLT
jgi:hypothetical protein